MMLNWIVYATETFSIENYKHRIGDELRTIKQGDICGRHKNEETCQKHVAKNNQMFRQYSKTRFPFAYKSI